MSAKVDELDTVHGLTHSVVVGEAVEISSGIISKMADALAQRIGSEAGVPPPPPETAPAATVPAEPKTTPVEPQTAPVTARRPLPSPPRLPRKPCDRACIAANDSRSAFE